jgi:hypothetical protein
LPEDLDFVESDDGAGKDPCDSSHMRSPCFATCATGSAVRFA